MNDYEQVGKWKFQIIKKRVFCSGSEEFYVRKVNFFTNPDHKTQFNKKQEKLSIMKYLNSVRKFFKFLDLFSTSQFLRFQQEGEYKTASGGICSMLVIVIFMTLFMSTAIQTINMKIITWSSTSQLLFDPTETIIPINPPASPFMFAIKLLGLNLNDNVRYFDIRIVEREYMNGLYEVPPRFVDMVPCTSQHFSLTDDIRKNTANLGIESWLCPPIGYNFSLKGKYTSPDMKLLQVRVTKCNETKDLTRPCASNATIGYYQQMLEQFILSLNFINPLINPGDQNYLSYYIEDVSYLKFTRKLGADSNGHIEDYTIDTDVSLLPFVQNVEQSGVIIPQAFQNIPFQITNDRYASFFFMKSARMTSYSRSFNKLDSFFSYVGGLVGTILGLMFVVSSFTSMAYELELAERICRYAEDKHNDFAAFSLLSYCLFVLYSIGKLCGLGQKFKEMRQAAECSDEAAKQLDVQLLLQRLLFLERAAEALLEEHQLHGLHLHRLDTLKEIKKRRKRYTLKHQREDSDSEEDSQIKSENNCTVIVEPNLSTSKNETLSLQDSSIMNLQRLPKRKLLPPIDQKILVIKQLHQQSLKGNKVSKRILQGIEQQKIGISLSDLTKVVNTSSEVIHLCPNPSLEFQFET